MGRSFKGYETETAELWGSRDMARTNRRAARETWIDRGSAMGEGSKVVDPRTGLTMRGDK